MSEARMGFCGHCHQPIIGVQEFVRQSLDASSNAHCPHCAQPAHWLVVVPTGWTQRQAIIEYEREEQRYDQGSPAT